MNRTKWIFLGVLAFILFIGFSASITIFVMKLMKGDAYQMSLSAISKNIEVVEIVGEPIRPSWFIMGNVSTSGPEGSASLEYSVEGPKGSGIVYVYATRKVGEWKLDTVVVSNNSNKQGIIVVDKK